MRRETSAQQACEMELATHQKRNAFSSPGSAPWRSEPRRRGTQSDPQILSSRFLREVWSKVEGRLVKSLDGSHCRNPRPLESDSRGAQFLRVYRREKFAWRVVRLLLEMRLEGIEFFLSSSWRVRPIVENRREREHFQEKQDQGTNDRNEV